MNRHRRTHSAPATNPLTQLSHVADVLEVISWLVASVQTGEVDVDVAIDVVDEALQAHLAGCGACQRNQARLDDVCRATARGPVVVAAGWFEECDWSILTGPYAASNGASLCERVPRSRRRGSR
jgi:hypothetical protein